MKTSLPLCFSLLTALAVLSAPSFAADTHTSIALGYSTGLNIQATAGILNFAQGFPLGLEFGVAYAQVDPGDAIRARRIFIANATNGTPEKSGQTWTINMDFVYQMVAVGPRGIFLLAGPRYAMFDGTFRYVGANEEFDITSHRWGLGLAAKGIFAINSRVDFVLSAGIDQFFKAALHGHDTTYSPDDENVNPKETFTFSDANTAVNAPKLQPHFLIGLGYSF